MYEGLDYVAILRVGQSCPPPPPAHQTACAEERYQGMATRSLKLMDGKSGLCGIRDVSKQSTFRAMPSEHTRGLSTGCYVQEGAAEHRLLPFPISWRKESEEHRVLWLQ